MTNSERRQAFDLRLLGRSWEEIGEQLRYAPTTVFEDMQDCLRGPQRTARCVYPDLRSVLAERYGGSVQAFAEDCGMNLNTAYAVLSGRCRMTESIAARIGQATGLSASSLTRGRAARVHL